MPYALCRIVPHLSEKGYIYVAGYPLPVSGFERKLEFTAVSSLLTSIAHHQVMDCAIKL
jgi:hypothetical protein